MGNLGGVTKARLEEMRSEDFDGFELSMSSGFPSSVLEDTVGGSDHCVPREGLG